MNIYKDRLNKEIIKYNLGNLDIKYNNDYCILKIKTNWFPLYIYVNNDYPFSPVDIKVKYKWSKINIEQYLLVKKLLINKLNKDLMLKIISYINKEDFKDFKYILFKKFKKHNKFNILFAEYNNIFDRWAPALHLKILFENIEKIINKNLSLKNKIRINI